MCTRNVNSTRLLRLGLVFLILANLLGFVSRRVATDLDFFTGAMFGITIGLLLLSIRLRGPDGVNTSR